MQNTFLLFHNSDFDKSTIDPEWQASTIKRQGILSGKFLDRHSDILSSVRNSYFPFSDLKQKA